jgi:hypothetical protein
MWLTPRMYCLRYMSRASVMSLLALIAMIAASGCGSGNSQTSSASPRPTAGDSGSVGDPKVIKVLGERTSVAIVPIGDRRHPNSEKEDLPDCSSGSVWLNQDAAGAIDFRVRCKREPAESAVWFGIMRTPFGEQGKLGIRAFRKRPVVVAADGSRTFGMCMVIHTSVACRSHVDKPILFLGRIWVNPKTQCDFQFSIFNLTTEIIASSKPRGC